MFAKLLKYEWRSNAVTFGILSGAVLLLSVLGGFLLRQLILQLDQLSGIAMFTSSITLFFIVLSLVGYVIAVEVMLLARFYKNKFTDEGYLTFTLPVNVHQIFLSSAANMMVWQLISSLVLSVGFLLIVLISGEKSRELMQEVVSISGNLISTETEWLNFFANIVNWVYQVVLPMICLTLGAIWAKKHKILASFGIYYLIGVIIGIMESVISLSISIGDMFASEDAYAAAVTESIIVTLIVRLVIIAGGYFLCTHLMKRKLNLN